MLVLCLSPRRPNKHPDTTSHRALPFHTRPQSACIPRVTCRRDVTPALVLFPKSARPHPHISPTPLLPPGHPIPNPNFSLRPHVHLFLACFAATSGNTVACNRQTATLRRRLRSRLPRREASGSDFAYPGLAGKEARRVAAEKALTAIFVLYSLTRA
ncbi:hypothetical protein LZ30DRAFT_351998 [Colletotrichum cereale]|nr:hypothetical protein LZ30DRAFT_351998 [Colletotrichum cereale]